MDRATYKITEVAELLSISRTYAYRLAKDGELPVPVVYVGDLPRVRKAELDLWLLGSAAPEEVES